MCLEPPHTANKQKQKQTINKKPEYPAIDPWVGEGGVLAAAGLVFSLANFHDLCPSRKWLGLCSQPKAALLQRELSAFPGEEKDREASQDLGSRTQGSALLRASPSTDALESSLHVKLKVSPCTHPGGSAISDCCQLLCVPSVSLFPLYPNGTPRRLAFLKVSSGDFQAYRIFKCVQGKVCVCVLWSCGNVKYSKSRENM